MSRNRFEDILRCLHFCDNNQEEEKSHDRLWKFGDFMTKLMRNFENSINPGEFICVDESLVSFKGLLSFKQYNPLKRSRFGIKYFAIVACETKFLMKIIVYLGKSSLTEVPFISEYGLGGSTVLKLLENLFWKNHKLVIDNWFNSPKLQEYLVLEKTFCLGSVRQSRKLMPKFKTKLKEGEVEVYTSGYLVLERWRDRREAVMLNTFVPHVMLFSDSRNPQNSRNKPISVLLYNNKMGGVDYIDQKLAPYESLRKTVKWYKKFAFHLIDLTIHNSHVLF